MTDSTGGVEAGQATDDLVMLRIPCARKILPKLLAGMPVFSIRLEEVGDGTHNLIVVGVNGPLSDPFPELDGASS